MLHWSSGIAVLAVGALLGGCAPKPSAPTPPPVKPAVQEKPKSSLTIAGSVQRPDLTLLDANGVVQVRIVAAGGSVAPSGAGGDDAFGQVQNGTATLYENGTATATLRADRIQANQKTRLVTGIGNVVVRSLVQAESPTLRADKATWRPDDGIIRGSGNVVATRGETLRVPGTAFEADTRIRRFMVKGSGDAPITGRL